MSIDQERSIITIDPAEIDISRGAPLRVRRHLPGEPGESEADRELTESILLHGVLQPPLLVSMADASPGRPFLIHGFRRLAAARTAEISRVDAVLRTAEPERRIAVLLWWLAGFASGDPLSDLERILLIEKTYAFTGDVPPRALSAAYGENISARIIKDLRRILDLDDAVQEALHRGEVSAGDLIQLMEHPYVDANEAAAILAGERLTRSEQKKAVRLMLRIGDGGKEEWERFVESHEPGGDPLLTTLERTCHPTYTRDRARIECIVRNMHLPPGTSIQPPDNMEGGSYRLQMRIRGERSFEQALDKLRNALESGEITKLLKILRGETEFGEI